MSEKVYDVIIIGAGLSGLAAGIRLAYFGKKVCLLEQHSKVGGLNSFYQFKGMTLDAGLHALTNFVSKGNTSTPLAKLSRQLRIKLEEFELSEQNKSCIHFPEKVLEFTNNLEYLKDNLTKVFPYEANGFLKLLNYIEGYDATNLNNPAGSAKKVVRSFLTDPLLIDMLFCPLMYYGSAQENDMDISQFAIMFRSIFWEGFARPIDGIIRILNLLVEKFLNCGGELHLKTEVKKVITKGKHIEKIILNNGEELEAKYVISSAGLYETLNLCFDEDQVSSTIAPILLGQLSFVEAILFLNKRPEELGYSTTITFYNDSDRFKYERPQTFVDLHSGVICCPDNFQYKKENEPQTSVIRITNIANFDLWSSLDKEGYLKKKKECFRDVLTIIERHIPGISEAVVDKDIFTPITIKRFTGHINGAVYGTPKKTRDGTTRYDNLFICGTDQGFLGVVGTMLSGITMANLHCLNKISGFQD
ncbi:MAG: NAD(P)/FAD-dependent oxidoreductase [bacterium]